jgi:hypothetical protein
VWTYGARATCSPVSWPWYVGFRSVLNSISRQQGPEYQKIWDVPAYSALPFLHGPTLMRSINLQVWETLSQAQDRFLSLIVYVLTATLSLFLSQVSTTALCSSESGRADARSVINRDQSFPNRGWWLRSRGSSPFSVARRPVVQHASSNPISWRCHQQVLSAVSSPSIPATGRHESGRRGNHPRWQCESRFDTMRFFSDLLFRIFLFQFLISGWKNDVRSPSKGLCIYLNFFSNVHDSENLGTLGIRQYVCKSEKWWDSELLIYLH